MAQYKFTSESVSEGHPDKLADQISDAIVDEALRLAGDRADKVRCACETLVKRDLLVVAGEMRNPGEGGKPGKAPDYLGIAKQVAKEIGYCDPKLGFDPENCKWVNGITDQSPEIAQGVDAKGGGDANCCGTGGGAGDQGLMFGYACSETKSLMPLPIYLAHKLVRRQAKLRNAGANWLRPDAKSQVTVVYENGKPVKVDTVVLSTQHAEEIDGQPYDKVLCERVVDEIIKPVLDDMPHDVIADSCRFLVNPTGKFVIGGPQADAGLTGRKIIVDTYGGAAPHGGGAFSGKDPSKVDRSATYAARQLAKNVVAAKLATRCLVQVSYAIGVAEPVSMMVDTFGTGTLADDKIAERLAASFDMTPKGIIERLDLLRPIYRQTAAYGHFGREDVSLPWEDTSLAAKLAD